MVSQVAQLVFKGIAMPGMSAKLALTLLDPEQLTPLLVNFQLIMDLQEEVTHQEVVHSMSFVPKVLINQVFTE